MLIKKADHDNEARRDDEDADSPSVDGYSHVVVERQLHNNHQADGHGMTPERARTLKRSSLIETADHDNQARRDNQDRFYTWQKHDNHENGDVFSHIACLDNHAKISRQELNPDYHVYGR